MRYSAIGLIIYCLLDTSIAAKSGNSQNSPDLSRLREDASSEGGLDLSLGIGRARSQQEKHDANTNPVQPNAVFDMRTKEFKQLQKQYPEVDFRSERQKTNQKYQKDYKKAQISKLNQGEYAKVKTKIQKSKKESLKRRIQIFGYGYGLQGEIDKLRKKEKDEGRLSVDDTAKLSHLRKQNSDRVFKGRQRQKAQDGPSTVSKSKKESNKSQ